MMDHLLDAKLIAAVLALMGTLYAIWSNNRIARLKADIDLLTLELNRQKQSSEREHTQRRYEFEVAQKATETLYRELTELREAAATLLAVLELAAEPEALTTEMKHNGLKAAKRLSLFYPPNTSFAEEVNSQLSWAERQLFGQIGENRYKWMAALTMNIWLLTNTLMQEQHRRGSEDREKYRNLVPYRAVDVV